MKTKDLFIYLLLLSGIYSLVNTCNCNEPAKKIVKPDYKKSMDSLKIIDKSYRSELKRYQMTNDSLTEKLAKTNALLQKEKAKISLMKKSVRGFVQSDWKNIPTEVKLEKCDSMIEAVKIYETERAIDDSLTEIQICTINELLAIKDQQLTQCDQSYEAMKQSLEQSISDSKNCSNELEKLDKKMKRKRFINKILGTGAAVITIVATTLFITGAR